MKQKGARESERSGKGLAQRTRKMEGPEWLKWRKRERERGENEKEDCEWKEGQRGHEGSVPRFIVPLRLL